MLHTSPVAIPGERQKTIAISMLGLPDRLKLFQNCQKHDYVSPAIDVLFFIEGWYHIMIATSK